MNTVDDITYPLPQLKSDVSFSPFYENGAQSARILVSTEDRSFVINTEAYELLTALAAHPQSFSELTNIYQQEGRAALSPETAHKLIKRVPDALWTHTIPSPRKDPLTCRFGLIPTRLLEPITTRLTWVYDRALALPLLLIFLALHASTLLTTSVTFRSTPSPSEAILIYAAVMLAMLLHEVGHATACTRFGCKHGGIGFGLYWFFPVFYADVTHAWKLPPNARAVVDMGGVYFQVLMLIPLDIIVLVTGNYFCASLQLIVQYLILQTINPLWKMDGYWLLTDLSGLTNLHKRVGLLIGGWFDAMRGRESSKGPSVTPIQKALLLVYTFACVGYGLILTVLIIRMFRYTFVDYPHLAAIHIAALASALHYGQVSSHLIGDLHSLLLASLSPAILLVVSSTALLRCGQWAASRCNLAPGRGA